jgi:L-asparagine transporter-like permease
MSSRDERIQMKLGNYLLLVAMALVLVTGYLTFAGETSNVLVSLTLFIAFMILWWANNYERYTEVNE